MPDQIIAGLLVLLGLAAGLGALLGPLGGILILIIRYLRRVFVKGPLPPDPYNPESRNV